MMLKVFDASSALPAFVSLQVMHIIIYIYSIETQINSMHRDKIELDYEG